MDENWCLLKVRAGFAPFVVQKLRKLDLEVSVPAPQPVRSRLHRDQAEYLYCRFDLHNPQTLMMLPGVLDIVQKPGVTP
jgi:hypothetical protein